MFLSHRSHRCTKKKKKGYKLFYSIYTDVCVILFIFNIPIQLVRTTLHNRLTFSGYPIRLQWEHRTAAAVTPSSFFRLHYVPTFNRAWFQRALTNSDGRTLSVCLFLSRAYIYTRGDYSSELCRRGPYAIIIFRRSSVF